MVRTCPSPHFAERPSAATRKLWLRLSTSSVTSALSGITNGRAVRLWGATGVRLITPVWGTIIGPPFDREYAVEPVGVLTISPSA